MLRVLVVDDSHVARRLLTEILDGEADIEVVGEAVNGEHAVMMVPTLRPDVITMDIRMPVMDGYAATREIMMCHPTPIVVVSGSMERDDIEKSIQALDAGALTVIGKPPSPSSDHFEKAVRTFVGTVRSMAAVGVIRRHRPTPVPVAERSESACRLADSAGPGSRPRIVVIAASTGGPQALRVVLSQMTSEFPVPVVVVQHISAGFTDGLADWLQRTVQIPLQIARNDVSLRPGMVYIAPEGMHCSVNVDRRIELIDRPPLGGFRPSATVLFESASRAYGDSVIAVILTGMGADGVEGLRSIRQMHGVVLGQDEASSVVFGMPKAAWDAGVVDKLLPLDEIGRELSRMVGVSLTEDV